MDWLGFIIYVMAIIETVAIAWIYGESVELSCWM